MKLNLKLKLWTSAFHTTQFRGHVRSTKVKKSEMGSNEVKFQISFIN